MKIGLKLPNCAGVLCEPDWATPDRLEDLSRLAHGLGFDSLWMHDHLLPPEEVSVKEPRIHEPLITIARLASLVPRIQFGVAVLVLPLRDPVLLARQAGTLHAFFPGRLILGVGVGRYETEFAASGSPSFHQRGRVTDEFLRLIRALWEEEAPTFQGEFRSVSKARLHPKPPPADRIPIWVGGNARVALKRAAALGDGYVPASRLPEEIRAHREQLAVELERRGRPASPFPLGLSMTVELMRPGDRAVANMEERGMHGHEQERIVQGGPHLVAERLNRLAAAGVDHFLLSFRALDFPQLLERLDRFAREVRPRLEDREKG